MERRDESFARVARELFDHLRPEPPSCQFCHYVRYNYSRKSWVCRHAEHPDMNVAEGYTCKDFTRE